MIGIAPVGDPGRRSGHVTFSLQENADAPRPSARCPFAAISLAANLYLVRVTWSAGRELNSPSLLALARDNGSDVLTSLLVIVAIGLSLVGLDWAEPVASALIGGLIFFMTNKHSAFHSDRNPWKGDWKIISLRAGAP